MSKKRTKDKFIITRCSKHSIEHANTGKKNLWHSFVDHYLHAVQKYIDYLWENTVIYTIKNETKTFSVKDLLLECPRFMDYNLIKFDTPIYARALSSAATQACGMVKAAIEKRRKQLFKLNELQSQNINCKKLEERIEKTPLVKPTVRPNLGIELSSKCCLFIKDNRYFGGWLKLKCLGKQFGIFHIPVKFHKHSAKLQKKDFKMLGSFLFRYDLIDVRWRKTVLKKKEGCKVGGDPGINTTLTLTTDHKCKNHPHGHTYKDVLKKMTKKKYGSKGFKKAADFRRNIVGWEINQIDWNGVKEFDCEDNSKLHFENYKGALLARNSWRLVKSESQCSCEESGVQIIYKTCTYRSQRCSCCGWVQKKNRNGKEFCCLMCFHMDDSDKNSSFNQIADIPDIPNLFRQQGRNIQGFYWKKEGFFDIAGQELGVPDVPKGEK